jgi:hypothetical protein
MNLTERALDTIAGLQIDDLDVVEDRLLPGERVAECSPRTAFSPKNYRCAPGFASH